VATAREPAKLEGDGAMKNVLVPELDVTKPAQVAAPMKATEARFGGIDVLVNTAGIGYFAALEEGEEAVVRKMFEVDVFGMTRMIQAALPGMRKLRTGCIANFSSIGAICTFPAIGYCNATKFAVEGLSGALWPEVEPLGIRVMLVEPSGLRSEWAGRSANESAVQIDDYVATVGAVRAQVGFASGRQAGDPVRAAKAIVLAVGWGNPPHHLLLGKDAFDDALAKVEKLRTAFSLGEAVARAADFPKSAQKSVV
jgi:NAD(P)-dependent dehydrogenase (short-subunit alcohol dehydrogenase family)